ncbi:class I SAM-dependent methyltransferase [Kocuria marina]|uniref:class I SAM-dependent methyltransferase n=1 Tax=Kocuria marina TaxID=223184 RepID=UPI0021A6F4CD|nr:class I SAM-dependent methyltransferase [Kocuria marina]MCT1616229.1 class I SAM-dependent methyltransferase [Kocuria marina]
MTKQKFDGLAEEYDQSRPRYPEELWDVLTQRLPRRDKRFVMVDAGAGTGIALEGLLPRIPADSQVTAIDISSDMVRVGATKFPQVEWITTEAEPFLEGSDGLDLVVVAQAYQWMDRSRFTSAAYSALRSGGLVAIIQNNRDFEGSDFLDAYETLLEIMSPGYSRGYRSFDIRAELENIFEPGKTGLDVATWERPMSVGDFVEMSSSSTQVQRAIAAYPGFLEEVRNLAEQYAREGSINIVYRSELYTAEK